MSTRVLIIGGYGNFGQMLCKMLAQHPHIHLLIAGRSAEKAASFAAELKTANPVQPVQLDICNKPCLQNTLSELAPDVVIHTSGPFQDQAYHVAQACIAQGCHYMDLADARAFVAGISELDCAAQKAGVLICSGASSVPALTSAIIDQHLPQFSQLTSLDYGIATAQQTSRGLATIKAVLSYAGEPFTSLESGNRQKTYGWLGLRWRDCWQLGLRTFGNCDIPDLEIFPVRYPGLQSIRFQAGTESTLSHLGLWALSWLRRLKLFPPVHKLAPVLLSASALFDRFGTDRSGFFMQMSGIGLSGTPKTLTFDLVAKNGDGLNIPIVPAALLAKKIADGKLTQTGATPCVDLISLDEYLSALSPFAIEWRTTETP